MATRRDLIKGSIALGSALTVLNFSRDVALAAGTAVSPGGVAKGKHLLPPLPYAEDALEPYIDAQTMKLHHDLHHAAYVKGLNSAEVALDSAAKSKEEMQKAQHMLAFHGSGHFNHTVFWYNMNKADKCKKKPTGALGKLIDEQFNSLDNLQTNFSAAAAAVDGNGWGALVYHPTFKRLYVLGMQNHQDNFFTGAVPLLLCDVWEHAYYLKYQNKRPDYVKNWWNVVDWSNVEARFSAAQKLIG